MNSSEFGIASLLSLPSKGKPSSSMTQLVKPAAKKALSERRRPMHRLELENSLSEFFQAAWPHFDPAPYTHRWHIDAIAERLEA
jgi:hypothetical protein